MSGMGDVNKRQVSTRLDIETCRKVEKTFSRPEDGGKKSLAYVRALEEATRNVVLEEEDYEIILAEVKANKRKRGEH